MNRVFLRRAVSLPAIMALVLALCLFLFLKFNIDKFIPLYNDTQYAYHDEIVDDVDYKEDKNASLDSFVKNQCIGEIKIGEGFPIRYDMDYSNIQTSVSFMPQSVPFGETGFTYLYAGNDNAKEIEKQRKLTIGSVFGEKHYKLKSKESFNSENSVLNFAPRAQSAVIIYYHDSNTAGFTSKYVALVYEEVE